MKAIPTGKDDLKKIIDGNYYYVDKTMIIQDILKEEVILYSRPRRLGRH